MKPAQLAATPLLSVENLTHLYAPGKGFSDVSFQLYPGEVLGIVGESGSGKTTLLKSISARLAPNRGKSFIDPTGSKNKICTR